MTDRMARVMFRFIVAYAFLCLLLVAVMLWFLVQGLVMVDSIAAIGRRKRYGKNDGYIRAHVGVMRTIHRHWFTRKRLEGCGLQDVSPAALAGTERRVAGGKL